MFIQRNFKTLSLSLNLLVYLIAANPLNAAETAAPQAEEKSDTGETPLTNWWHGDYLTGDLGGFREEMEENGFSWELIYTVEIFSNLRGGLNTHEATEYRGNIDLTLTWDTEKLGLWRGGRFFFYGQNGHGKGITDRHVGDVQVLSNIDADDFYQISEVWLEQNLLDERLCFKIGKQDASADFCAPDFGGEFINSSFGFAPNIPIPTFPDPALGFRVLGEPAEGLTAGAGIYDGDGEGGETGFNTTFDGKGGFFSLIEAAFRLHLGPENSLPGAFKIGGWYHSQNVEEITQNPEPTKFSENNGFYLILDQLLYSKKADPDEPEGLGAFLQFSWAPKNRNEISNYYGGGVVYTGLMPGRKADVTGLGLARVVFSNRIRQMEDKTYETAIELFHKIQLSPWLCVKPDVQFIFNPGGDGRNALAAGMRLEISF